MNAYCLRLSLGAGADDPICGLGKCEYPNGRPWTLGPYDMGSGNSIVYSGTEFPDDWINPHGEMDCYLNDDVTALKIDGTYTVTNDGKTIDTGPYKRYGRKVCREGC